MELLVLLAFTIVLMVSIALDLSLVLALAVGYCIFFTYAKLKGNRVKEILSMSISGVKTVKNMLITFIMIGVVTALWRASGTIPVIICYAAKLIHPSVFVMIAFLLNAMVSILTGTAFGTAATMGVICMTMALAMGINPMFVGGAILAGVYYGDRCSPVSTSALLVSELTKTDLYDNIKGMIRTCIGPTILTCVFYLILGFFSGGGGAVLDVESMFTKTFELHWILMVPALMILVLAAFRVPVRQTLLASIAVAAVLCVTVQKTPVGELFQIMVFGYQSPDPEMAAMMNGGGIASMITTSLVVGISSSFAGIFEGTGLLNGLKHHILNLSKKITPYGATMVGSVLMSMIACNQALSTILTSQLCRDVEADKRKFALNLENTVIVMAPLVPWSIAGAVPLATVGAPLSGILFAFYLYCLPIWHLFGNVFWKKK